MKKKYAILNNEGKWFHYDGRWENSYTGAMLFNREQANAIAWVFEAARYVSIADENNDVIPFDEWDWQNEPVFPVEESAAAASPKARLTFELVYDYLGTVIYRALPQFFNAEVYVTSTEPGEFVWRVLIQGELYRRSQESWDNAQDALAACRIEWDALVREAFEA